MSQVVDQDGWEEEEPDDDPPLFDHPVVKKEPERNIHHSPTVRRCVLCGRVYYECKCTCSWCGEKKWKSDHRGEWEHHVCKNAGRIQAGKNARRTA